MSAVSQSIDSAYGLNKDARLKAQAHASASLKSPSLDPDYPFYMLPFDPAYYGTPQQITPADLQDYS